MKQMAGCTWARRWARTTISREHSQAKELKREFIPVNHHKERAKGTTSCQED
jgi:hypothetical protein